MKKQSIRVLLPAFLAFVVLLFSTAAFSQAVTGKVVGADGQPLSGVTIQIKGEKVFAITDAMGNYTITTGAANATLIFSYIGFEKSEVNVSGKTVFNITLAQRNKELVEVVVTALGIKKEEKKVGYAVQTVKGDELAKARDEDMFNQLEGKVAGITIAASPEMLTRPQIISRGTKDMLIVVDGVPINSDTWNINADDVESMTILKGPNAAALYGFRGQNGAIVVTTKRGSRDSKGWTLSYNTSDMLDKGFLVYPKDQTEYGRGTHFLYSFGNGLDDHTQRLPVWGPRFDGQLIQQYNSPYDVATGTRSATPWESIGGNNYRNFIDAGFLSTNNISLSTSGANSDIRMSYSHVYQKGTDPNSKLNMDNLNVFADYDISSRLKFETNVNMNFQYTPQIPDADYGPNSYVYMFNVYGPSDYDVRDLKDYYKSPMGIPGLRQYNENYGRDNNPYFMANQWLRGHNKVDMYGYLKATYKITHDLEASLRTQVTTWSQTRTEKVPAGTILNQYLPWYYWGWYGDYREDRRNLLENNSDFLLAYNPKIRNWNFSANLGASERSFQYNSSWATTVDLAVPGVYSLSNSQTPALAFNWGSKMQVYSGYYSFDLGYRNFFNVATTGRVDNTSTLPSGDNTFFYPSVSISSSLTDYLNLPRAISFLKLRASYADVKGALTSSQAPSAYSLVNGYFQGTGASTNNLLGYGFENFTSYDGPTYANQSAYSLSTYYNNEPAVTYSNTKSDPNLKPFDVKSYEAGLDYRMFNNRVGLDLTYFNTINGPQIYGLPVPSSTTYQYQNVNGVTTLKTGWEILLNLTPIQTRSGFKWDLLVNWSTYKEVLHSIYPGVPLLTVGNHNYTIGERLDDFYSTGFVRDGLGNIVMSNGGPVNAPSGLSNNIYLGHLNPDYSFGITNRISYKSFSFSFQVDGRVGGKVYDDVWYKSMNGGNAVESDQGAFKTARASEWLSTSNGTQPIVAAYVAPGVVIASGTPTYVNGQISNLKDLTFTPNTTAVTVQNYLSSDISSNFDEYYMISRTFVKLRDVQIAYSLPKKLLGNSAIKTASISFVGRNLLYFAKRKDFDIDQYGSGTNVSNYGVQQSGTSSDVTLSSPTFRRWGMNLNFTF
jgi:TonB-linked SusC/RagA family outer membrane protein